MNEREALDRIAALPSKWFRSSDDYALARWVRDSEVRAVLAEVTPEPGGVLDHDQARDRLWAIFNDEDVWDQGYPHVIGRILDAVAGCVRPAAIDRDELLDELWDGKPATARAAAEQADRILALVRPVAGVTLTPEEADLVLGWRAYIEVLATALREATGKDAMPGFSAAERALTARLEAAS